MALQSFPSCICAFAMMDFEDSNTDRGDARDDEFDFLLVATQCIINNNVVWIHYLRHRRRRRCRRRTQQHFHFMRVVEKILLLGERRGGSDVGVPGMVICKVCTRSDSSVRGGLPRMHNVPPRCT